MKRTIEIEVPDRFADNPLPLERIKDVLKLHFICREIDVHEIEPGALVEGPAGLSRNGD